MPGASDATIVVATYNRIELLPKLLDALRAQTAADLDVVIVDNGSSDGTWDLLADTAAEDPRIRPIRIENNRGPAPARNLGWRSSTRDLIAFTDDDCVPDEGWLEALVATHDAERLIVQGRTCPVTQTEPRGWFDRSVNVQGWTGLFETCNLLVERALLEELGGFSEDFAEAMGEDTDLGYRAMAAGAGRAFAPDAVVRHHVWKHGFRDFCSQRRRYARSVAVVRRNPQTRRDLLVARVFIRPIHALIWGLIPVLVGSIWLGVPWLVPAIVVAWSARNAYRRRRLPMSAARRLGYSVATFAGYVYEAAWFAIESVRYRTLVI